MTTSAEKEVTRLKSKSRYHQGSTFEIVPEILKGNINFSDEREFLSSQLCKAIEGDYEDSYSALPILAAFKKCGEIEDIPTVQKCMKGANVDIRNTAKRTIKEIRQRVKNG